MLDLALVWNNQKVVQSYFMELLYYANLSFASRRVIGKALGVPDFKRLCFLFSDLVCRRTWRRQRL